MKSLPCPRCGKKEVLDTFCEDCERELHPLIEKIKEHTITICVKSGNIKLKTAWERIDLQQAFDKTVNNTLIPSRDSILSSMEFSVPEIEYINKPGMDKVIELPVTVTGERNGVERQEVYDIPIHIKTTISGKYAKIGTEYYEGTLQLRNEKPIHEKALEKLFNKQPDLAINKTTSVSTGHDYQITDKQRMRQIAHKLYTRFGGILKENARLITRDKQKSKDVYRLTILIEFPPFEKGDVVTDDKRLLQVQGFSKKTRYQNVITGKKVEELYEKDKFTLVEKYTTTVSQTQPKLAILDPKTYQQVPVKTREPLTDNQSVTVVQYLGSWYVV